MTQPAINLLPQSIHAQQQAGLRTGRIITAVVAGVIIVAIAVAHSRIELARSQERFRRAETQADLLFATERKIEELCRAVSEARDYIDRYERVALPLDMSALIATLVNAMPPSVSLDRIDLDAGSRNRPRTSRSRPADDDGQRRVLTGELAGFAASDEEIAELVRRLDDLPLFTSVSLDFSRTRTVRERMAREFRISFRANLDERYIVLGAHDDSASSLSHAVEDVP